MASPAFQATLRAGRRPFEAGAYFEAHEAFEAGWRVVRGDEKRVLQVLVLWAAALHHHELGRGGGARRLLARALERLSAVREGFDGVDLDALKGAVIDTWGQLVSGDEVRAAWPAAAGLTPLFVPLDHLLDCPTCGARFPVMVAPEDAAGASYVEDCPVCCRPSAVTVERDGCVQVRRLDA
ncbi:MAG: CPXCG motif-containing cysteine-rich protein [Myxococcaceae bacterium]|jgi:hypothetical protein|nr:CPXCG motif-containing cysteine-rich protein [Myxococcaceae bacterium]MCA3011500.1 CPXCG motif-containing cysteine-rich protein [Myxococcaceae bacterium]